MTIPNLARHELWGVHSFGMPTSQATRVYRLSRLGLLINAIFYVMGMLQSAICHAAPSLSRAMHFECKNIPEYQKGDLDRDDAWVQSRLKGFLPEPGDNSLRITSLQEQAIEVASALQTVRATCHAFRNGEMAQQQADLTLSAAEEVIANFIAKLSSEAHIKAVAGQVSDMPAIRVILTDVAGIARQNALLGEDLLADAAWNLMIATVTDFDDGFAQSCKKQVFDQNTALDLERQRQVLGLTTDLSACARRIIEAKSPNPGEGRGDNVGDILWEHCTNGTYDNGSGKWKITETGGLVGTGTGIVEADFTGTYSLKITHWALWQSNVNEEGKLELRCLPDKDCYLNVFNAHSGGTINFPKGPRTVSSNIDHDAYTVAEGQYPATLKRFDHPCDPEDLGF